MDKVERREVGSNMSEKYAAYIKLENNYIYCIGSHVHLARQDLTSDLDMWTLVNLHYTTYIRESARNIKEIILKEAESYLHVMERVENKENMIKAISEVCWGRIHEVDALSGRMIWCTEEWEEKERSKSKKGSR